MSEKDMVEQFKLVIESVGQMITDSENRMKAYMELELGKRIDTLFDGYKLTHEKQWELEHKTEHLEAQINDLQTRLSALEKKISA